MKVNSKVAGPHRILIKKDIQSGFGFKAFFFPKVISGYRRLEFLTQIILQEQCRRDHLPFDFELSIIITDDAGIARLNQKYRSKRGPTDVLSFPLIDFPGGPGTAKLRTRPQKLRQILAEWPDQPGPLLLGDVIISYAACIRQARQRGLSTEAELLCLLIHGILHLFGYDHEKKKSDRLKMLKRERELYQELATGFLRSKTRKAFFKAAYF